MKVSLFKQQILYMMKRKLKLSLIRRILKLSYPKTAIPSINNIKNYLSLLQKKNQRKKKSPANKTPKFIMDFIYRCCNLTQGLESTPILAQKIAAVTKRKISLKTIRRIRKSYGYRYYLRKNN